MRRSKRKHNNRLRRKHLDKLARAKLAQMTARWDKALSGVSFSEAVIMPSPDTAFWSRGPHSFAFSYSNIQPLADPYIPPPELEKIRKEIQALINIEKKRIRQEYLTTRTGKGQQDG